ncbi:serine/threonine-protein kinase [Acrasis kona]|uniref:Serine/threonine-protein kinase n=1 Tax=Acrasis kona TaxID=1008807 RepID=A0AAW2ZCS2_9EUKA
MIGFSFRIDSIDYILIICFLTLKSLSIILSLSTCAMQIYIRFNMYSKTYYESNIKNAELSIPLVGGPNSQQDNFEKDIQTWIIDLKDLKFEERISEGGYGIVFRAKYKGSAVAVKKMKSDNDNVEFENEVRTLIALRHPNIVLFMGAYLAEDHKIIMTELMSFSVDSVLHKKKRLDKSTVWHVALTLKQKISILSDICRAMSFMHTRDHPLCHRDLKPSNVLLDKNLSVAKICDFGTSKSISTATMTGNIGTFMYMSPEILHNLPYNESCDVYSFGIVMHEIFFEVRPYTTSDGSGAFTNELTNPYLLGSIVASGKRPDVPNVDHATEQERKYLDLMMRCWNQDGTLRPSFTQALDELDDMQ